MKKLLSTSRVVLFTLAFLPACGGGSNPVDSGKKDSGKEVGGDDGGMDTAPDTAPACPTAGTCGGNIVGGWKISSSCLDVDVSGAIPDYCPTATAAAMGFDIKGTLTYRADLTYSRQTTITGSIVITFPASCLTSPDGGSPLTCDLLAAQLKLDNTYSAVACAAAGTGCACTGTLAPQGQTKTGMYSTNSAGLLTETETGRTPPDKSDYCIKTDTLTTSPHSMGMGMGMTASGTIAATRIPAPAPDAGSDASDASSDAPKPDAGSDAATTEAGGDATGG